MLDKVTGEGAEGLMIKNPSSAYVGKRSDDLQKVKKFDDSEAVVYDHQKGTGRCSGMMGALLLRDDNGLEFKCGSGFDDAQRRKPPKIGCRITIKHMGRSESGKPRFPIFLRIHPGM